ncbi:MAG TPA: holo-ACP synthase [Dissulfurispiraceae bacterium]
MIYGIGTDIVEIDRVRLAVEKWGEGFLERIFSERELFYCNAKKDPMPHFAARFAAKESLIKALTPLGPLPLKEIEVLNHPSGKPFIALKEGVLEDLFEGEAPIIHLTLTHERSHAVATVILERKAK